MPTKVPAEHRVEATIVGVDVEIPGYHVGFFVEHVTVTDTEQPIPEIVVEPKAPLLKPDDGETFDSKK